jgi:putative DNA methylase
MPKDNDLRLIEDYLPIEAISAEASREKSVRKGHISTLHLWWARRPLVACRAAVYGSLVPADRWVKEVKLKNPPENPEKAERVRNGKKLGLNRKAAAEFVTRLCKYPGEPRIIADAQKHILEAHAERLTTELADGRSARAMPAWVQEFKFTGQQVTYDDILAGRAPRPRVLDMFAGGGAIPLEALRLGCEAYALDLNPVAHIIELCTLVYPQKYGKPDPSGRGMTGPKNNEGESTWGGLAAEVRYWGEWVLKKVKAEIGDLYSRIPDPEEPIGRDRMRESQTEFATDGFEQRGQTEFFRDLPAGYLTPVAYLWTRTVTCKNPACKAKVPLAKQTWLCKKKDRCVALKVVAPKGKKHVRFDVVEARNEKGLGFDPSIGSEGGNAPCPFCHTIANAGYVQQEGVERRIGQQLMAVVCNRPGFTGKTYLGADDVPETAHPDNTAIQRRIDDLCARSRLEVPAERISSLRPSPNARGLSGLTRHGLTTFGDLFTNRQTLCLLTFAQAVQESVAEIKGVGCEDQRAKAVSTYLGILVDRQADKLSTFARWDNTRENCQGTFGRHAIGMVWDFVEPCPLGEASGGAEGALGWIVDFVEAMPAMAISGRVSRGSATELPYPDGSTDAVITDPPYYDNIPYADVSDFFYIWLKRSIGALYPEHFATELTPKKSEATALASRHGGNMQKATAEYEAIMLQTLREASRVLKPGGQLIVVYAHKTTLGWATLVDALRRAEFTVTEAWPLDTEMKARMVATDAAALASSIFLIARKRERTMIGKYEEHVQSELEKIVRERVETLWEQGVLGADLVIASVGAGLRAFTRYATIEYANGEEVPAERFLAEVEGAVLETLMAKILGVSRGGVAVVDPASRFYVLWRFVYKGSEIDSGEAIVFTYGQHVELDGSEGLSAGVDSLLEKKKGKYRLRDFTERGDDEDLGMPIHDGQAAPIIDALHRLLWLMENRPAQLPEFLREAQPNREQMRLVAQALAGPALKGGELADVSPSAEQAALAKLTANWKSVVEDAATTTAERETKRTGQKTFEM